MGIFGLTQKERNIWNNIKPGDRAQIFLGKSDNKAFETKVLDINDTNIYIKTPSVGLAYLELPRNLKVSIEIEMHVFKNGRARFVSWVRGQEWFKENAIRIASPKRIKWVDLRRKYRVEALLPVQFSFVDKKRSLGDLQIESPASQAELRNISEGGALIIVDKLTFVKVGDFINVKLELSSEGVWRARAKIIHIELAKTKYGLGIEWISLASNQSIALKEFVASKLKRSPTVS